MGFRYRRSINLGSGVRLNVSKRGLSSVSIGKPGSTLNFGRRGVQATVGLPGTGLSYTTGGKGRDAGGLALMGLVGAAFGLLFWLLGAAARGSRAAQVAIAGIAAFTLFACLHSPESGQVTPPRVSSPASPPSSVDLAKAEAVTDPSVPAAPALLANASIAALMKTTTGANLRAGPSPQAKVLQQLPAGALVEIVESEGRWAKVREASNRSVGWVARSLLASPESSEPWRSAAVDRRSKAPESVFDPADISAILSAAHEGR